MVESFVDVLLFRMFHTFKYYFTWSVLPECIDHKHILMRLIA